MLCRNARCSRLRGRYTMSIRGIDTQIMITRGSDFVREASSTQRQPEVNQEHAAAQQKVESTQDQSRVAATTETENEEIKPDADGAGSGAAGGEGAEQEEEEMTEEQKRELLVAPPEFDQIIDMYL